LNIDDVVEQAYKQAQNDPTVGLQKLKSIVWSDVYSDVDVNRSEVQLIHLHGYAPRLKSGREDLVFS
jgi:hypothetical protein